MAVYKSYDANLRTWTLITGCIIGVPTCHGDHEDPECNSPIGIAKVFIIADALSLPH